MATSVRDLFRACADATGKKVSSNEAAAVHVAGIPGTGCPATGCGVANAAGNGTLPLTVFNQALARVLYQEERFGFLGCDNTHADCKNPGGIGINRSGLVPLTDGPLTGTPQLGTKNGDAAIAQRVAEEGAVLLKDVERTLPITAADSRRHIRHAGKSAGILPAKRSGLHLAECPQPCFYRRRSSSH